MAGRLQALKRHCFPDILVRQAVETHGLAPEFDVRNRLYVEGKTVHTF